MSIRAWWSSRSVPAPLGPGAGPGGLLSKAVTHRTLLKILGATLGGAGLAELAPKASPAEARTPVAPAGRLLAPLRSDLQVDGNLTVTLNATIGGNETIGGSLRVGTGPDPGGTGRLEAQALYINGVQAIGSDGVIKQTYYAQ